MDRHDPDSVRNAAEAHFRQGIAFLDGKETPAAIDRFRQAVALQPGWAEAHFNLGIAFQDHGRPAEAIGSYAEALRCRPDMAEAHYNLGLVLQEQDRLDEAVGAYRHALELRPDFPEGWNNLGTALQDQGDLEQAAAAFSRAAAMSPAYTDAHYNLGSARHRQQRLGEAIAHYGRAIELDGRHHKAFNNLGKAYQDGGRIDQAGEAYRRALDVKPDYAEARFNLSVVQLLRGEYAAGWNNYEARFARGDWRRVYPHRFREPLWEGQSFAGMRLYVHGEQGFGDVLQFVRYLPRVKALGGTVILESRQALLPLLQNLPGADELAPLPGAEGPAVDFDLYVPLLSLPRIFKTTLETIPRAVPYLHADPERAQAWRARIDGEELRVGLVWAGTATEPSRACPLAWFTPITRLPGVKFYGLQKGPEADALERRGLPAGMQLRNLGREFNDFMDTAGAVENLDLVVSIDTSVAHLAGAMGMPVYLLLGDLPDWRWMLKREDSPWYPTMRLLRQETKGDWAAPLTRVARRLEELGAILDRARRVDGVAGLLAAAAHWHARGALGEALVFYRRVLAVRPDDPEALQGMGLVAYQTGNYRRAADCMQRAIAGSPQEDRYHYHLGLAQVALQAPQKAAEAFSRACRLNPANASARFNLSKLLRPEG